MYSSEKSGIVKDRDTPDGGGVFLCSFVRFVRRSLLRSSFVPSSFLRSSFVPSFVVRRSFRRLLSSFSVGGLRPSVVDVRLCKWSSSCAYSARIRCMD